ncbi:proline-rich transmembrane protein 1-like [Amphiura filiformis]|uniref:proline-rich transmembrane protein 1-like n=1 Tax=Amphiura filiformis TaxID=82378 RepID=UPI003B20F31C
MDQKQDNGYQIGQGFPLQQGYLQQGNPQQSYRQQGKGVQYNPKQYTQPNDYMCCAIFVTICCCLPLGIVAIVKSTWVRTRLASGDTAGAEEASRSAKCWSIAALVTGLLVIFTAAALLVLRIADGAVNNFDTSGAFEANYI